MMASIQDRNKKIAENGKATRLRRSSQVCKTFKLKIPSNRISKKVKDHLHMIFVESKWIYNYLLSKSEEIDIFDIVSNYKSLDKVTHYDKDRNLIETKITHVLSSVRQELMQQIADQIKGLAKLKAKGHDVGKLRYKSDFKSVKFKQYGVTHSVRGNKLKLQGCKDLIPLLGLKQLKKYSNLDITTMHLIKEVDDYYVCLTCYYDDNDTKEYKNDKIGIDLGISSNLTLSDGEKISCYVEESERTKKLQAVIARSKKGSNNRHKLRKKLERAYIKDRNRRNDLANKIVHRLVTENRTVVLQDDNLNETKDGKSGSVTSDVMQHSILGRVKTKLKTHKNVVWLDKWCPTTQYCNKCGTKTKLELSDRTFVCKKCGSTEDRDLHAASNMIIFLEIYASQELAGVLPNLVRWNQISKYLLSEEESTTSSALC